MSYDGPETCGKNWGTGRNSASSFDSETFGKKSICVFAHLITTSEIQKAEYCEHRSSD